MIVASIYTRQEQFCHLLKYKNHYTSFIDGLVDKSHDFATSYYAVPSLPDGQDDSTCQTDTSFSFSIEFTQSTYRIDQGEKRCHTQCISGYLLEFLVGRIFE